MGYIDQVKVLLLLQPPSHLQKGPQRIPARKHLQFPLHKTTQPQLRRRAHLWLVSSNTVQYGMHNFNLAFHCQPQSLALGVIASLHRDFSHMKPATRTARFVCWKRACWVGGMFSSPLRPFVNISFRASFTFFAWDCLLYIWTVNSSKRPKCKESRVSFFGSFVRTAKVL